MPPLLQVDSLTKRFGGAVVVSEVTFQLGEGNILGLIGPNGSGKTTLLNTLNGVHKPDGGRVLFREHSTTGLRPHQLAAAGLCRTFQNARVFHTTTAYQNILVPMLHVKANSRELDEKAMDLLDSVGLKKYADTPASELSGGQQKLLEFARALITDPKLVLMDEPFAGVHPEVKRVMLDRIRAAQNRNTSFIIVSHEIPALMGLCEKVICMSYGKVIAHDIPARICENNLVIEAYLGHGGSEG